MLGLGTPVLPPLPMHGGDRNRTSPFAFTGNKFEFRALGSSMSLGSRTRSSTRSSPRRSTRCPRTSRTRSTAAPSLEDAVAQVVSTPTRRNKQIVFDGDNYSEEWHAEAEHRGLENLRTTPDALPWVINDQTLDVFGNYGVLSERELESRFEVSLEQYVTKLNIEAETAASIARTQILPAAVRHLRAASRPGSTGLDDEVRPIVERARGTRSRRSRRPTGHPEDRRAPRAREYMRDTVIPAMDACRAVADRLERIVADDLWPLPKYAEMLFIK